MVNPDPASRLARVQRLSPFFSDSLEKYPLLGAVALQEVTKELTSEELRRRYRNFLIDHSSEPLQATLRSLRTQEMMRIIYRDLNRLAELDQTTNELSALAEFCVSTALDAAEAEASEKYGTPTDSTGKHQRLIVLAMGKLGAHELNLSSDIDLIFFYEESGVLELESGKQLSYQEYFLRVARQLIAYLDDSSAIGQVFRVDMRLRPYGDSGPLVIHRAAMEKYYLEQGRDWERYAFIKARVIAGDVSRGEDFLNWMQAFVYRRHLDFSAIQSLREMKSMITRQVELREMTSDLKLGPGGIREIEFIAQAHQLIWGGRYPDLQKRELLKILELLKVMEFIPATDADELAVAYRFLRNSEHVVQAEFDRQTHQLPASEESRQRLAEAMDYDDWQGYQDQLESHKAAVTRCFAQLIAKSIDSEETIDPSLAETWLNPVSEEVKVLRDDIDLLHLDDKVLAVLDRVMPRVLNRCVGTDDPSLSIKRMIGIVRSILRRSTYLVFLDENTDALERAVELVGISHWIAEQLENFPILLHELTDRSIHEVSLSRQELEGMLREVLRTVEQGDLENQMDTLRQFKLATTLKVASMELLDKLSIMEASDGLTALAEVLLDAAIDIAWQHLEAKHGLPCDDEGAPLEDRLAIIAYGKAGGLELAYGSDLDLVFMCPDHIMGSTDGAAPINNNMFYVRVGQRIIHILTSFTRFGILYSADMRLRPQGNKGPLVATTNAFNRYMKEDAWTWELQALIRARFVAGDRTVGARFGEIRREVINQRRDLPSLRQDVLDMREKMRTHLASDHSSNRAGDDASDVLGRFDLKHDQGAIVDIEFMVQYAVLSQAADHGNLCRWTDVMRLLDELGHCGVLEDEEVDALQRAYLAFRAAIHHEWLGLETDFERLQGYRHQVREIWDARMISEQ